MKLWPALVLLPFVVVGCQCEGTIGGLQPGDDGGASAADGGGNTGGDGGVDADAGTSDDAGSMLPDGGTPQGYAYFEANVRPALEANCSGCHTGGARFAFASVSDDHPKTYESFLDLISLDVPEQSRLIAKVLPESDPHSVKHAAGPKLTVGDATYQTFLAWAQLEKQERCPECGPKAPTQYLAYVEMPSLNWAIARDPIRTDHGLRERARILLQPMDPATFKPTAAPPIDFLPPEFCGADGRCDFGNLASSHDGKQLAFECRFGAAGEDWINDVRWNLCIADVGADGKAVNPRFLLPPELHHKGDTIARSDPFALYQNGVPLKGVYDMHFRYRRRDDKTPVFSPDDARIYYSTKSPEPRGGDDGSTSYHGFDLRNHIVAVKPDGTDRRTIYVNEGGEADNPFFLHNGNVAFHTWNLERMDRHLYTQATADGMMELPVLFGRVQGPNMWGKATQLANGLVLGITGNRRASVDDFVPFAADHTLGTGIDPSITGFAILDQTVFDQIGPFPNGYCLAPPDGPNCFTDRFYADATYSPDGRAFVAHNPEKTYVQQGEDMFLNYSGAPPLQDQLARLQQVVPQKMGIWLIDHHGTMEKVIDPQPGKLLRYPAWVGPRAHERVQPWKVDESKSDAVLHIADVPVWLSFRTPDGTNKNVLMSAVDTVVALRVLMKDGKGTACLNDGRPYRFAVETGGDDHPTALGMNNATGYKRFVVPQAMGGDAFGDIPLAADKSVRIKVPSNRLLLLQGINADGHVVIQHERLFTLPPGAVVDTGVKRAAYRSQCSSCHGVLAASESFVSLTQIDQLPLVPMDFDTASAGTLVDLTQAPIQELSFKGAVRPILDAHCVSCHSGANPGGELSLEKDYSPVGNYPAGKWASGTLSNATYLAFIPPAARVPAYNYSMSYSWVFHEDETPYQQAPEFAAKIAAHAPLAELSPWDPAYQNLFANDGSRYIYLSGFYNPNFGRADRLGGNSSDSWLIEILTGKDIDPVRNFTGSTDHKSLLSAADVRTIMAVIDVGWPYMTRCDDKIAPSGPNANQPWGEPSPK